MPPRETGSVRALVYERSVWRYLLAKGLNRVRPRTFFARVAPLRLRRIEFKPPGPDWFWCVPACAASAARTCGC